MILICPKCDYDLRVHQRRKAVRCPECGRNYSHRDIYQLLADPDRAGSPATLPAHERRVRGRLVVTVVVIGLALVVIAIMGMVSAALSSL